MTRQSEIDLEIEASDAWDNLQDAINRFEDSGLTKSGLKKLDKIRKVMDSFDI